MFTNQLRKIFGLFIIVFVTAQFTACENPVTGYGPQPSFLENQQHQPHLNIFGVLRPEQQNGLPQSFVHLEQIISVTAPYPDSSTISDAEVKIFHYQEKENIETVELKYTDFNTRFPKKEYRAANFYPHAGHTYKISCRRAGFPELTGQTTLPAVPQILEPSLKIKANEITFTILRDSQVALYDIYLLSGSLEYAQRVMRPEKGNIQVTLACPQRLSAIGKLIIYAYDLNLSEYNTYNLTIKLNTYKTAYSTVENGYGCFGSLNILEREIVFGVE